MSTQYDLIVIGSGPGGYVSAIRASQLGMKTAIVERESLGGICLNWGCIPTKALLRSAEVLHLAKNAKEFGLKIDKADFDLDAVVKRSRGVANQLSTGVKFLMKKNKIDVIEGTARLEKGTQAPKVIVKGKDGKETSFQAKHVMLATGARARDIPQAGLVADKKLIWTYREAMTPDVMPKRLLVIGSGAIGIEFASFYHELGAEVTVAEVMDRILPVEDEEISKLAEKDFKKQGLNIVTGAKVENLKAGKSTVTAEITDKSGKKENKEFDRAILAVGIVGNVEDLGLEDLGVKVEKTHVTVDNFGRTGVKGLYAIGDLTGPPWLAHKASHEGVVCVEGIAGADHAEPFDPWNVPGCTYAHPQVASVGLTEKAAKEKGYDIKVGRFPFIGNGKAIAMGASEGLVKTIFDKKTGELLGAHMIGAEVTELIQGYVIARQGELTEQDLAHTIFPHPTISESMHESVLDAEGRVIHI
ncbi:MULTISPECIES: dihydrolipoyl dehydrogenase [unclassified Hyphomonas]|jgi:dihydrolipoamide dehydrogenase|uniref:Dihydrolipoamide dehydrogenase of pyruvate dehydrogenase complex n=1 Tax=hydrothermal vent metagenome TaxID=652676 RepID=A0A160TZK0_9ZZZZ|nr:MULTISPECIES: dihydrolipoyl dehydrogenase [unclassified Hyphomonas]MAL47769.1 dihydrolipoyl dehydrogenase [Hyphomonas sp.]MAX85142.1 dihydrolipoyl dehydrogenase [Hyphomonas sp.]MBO6583510.1 dihydrolipoyl dehydrogenase [Hyphomonas sp.]QSR22490.1 dihydrolipoyl dehydrogenase [Hyphomonas sp. KY3]HBJ42899.1 dihydrolipoyl dehydrogenase [Hyphomonas sp.]|tara:strand:- start:4375 stop:5790 length:1416 start_codon:yes stop_codon:yes gene_type:complete